jgi:hypothetical protein
LSSSPSAVTDRWHSNPSYNRNNQTPFVVCLGIISSLLLKSFCNC